MAERIKVACYGLGPIGTDIAKLIARDGRFEIVAAVDKDPNKVGRDVGELLDRKTPLGVTVSPDAEQVLAGAKPQVTILATTSRLGDVEKQLMHAINAGSNVVSTSEELVYPYLRHEAAAQRLDEAARSSNVTVVGVGVNPGFVMDALVLMLTAPVRAVTKVRAMRVVDAAARRASLRRKLGVGLSLEEFRRQAQEGSIGHVGLGESAALIAAGLGWRLEEVRERLEPVVAKKPFRLAGQTLEAGMVAGLRQMVSAFVGGEERIALELAMFVGAEEPTDRIEVAGVPRLEAEIRGGLQGDLATAAIVVNTIPAAVRAGAGLKTVLDLPLPRAAVTGVG